MRTIVLAVLLGLVGCDSNPPQASTPETNTEKKADPAGETPKGDEPVADAPKADSLIVKICKAFDEEAAASDSKEMLLARSARRVTTQYGVAESELRGLERPSQLLEAIAREGNPAPCTAFREHLQGVVAAE